jgi:hypothetical protein
MSRTQYSMVNIKDAIKIEKRIINGVNRNVYKLKRSKKEYVKYKNNLYTIDEFIKNNRKKGIKKGGTVNDLNDKEKIEKIRGISVKCCDKKKVQEYIKKMCNNIILLIDIYAENNNEDKLKVYIECLSGKNNYKGKDSAGQINITNESIFYIQTSVNVREGMTLIMNFAMNGCKIILWALAYKPELIENGNLLKDRIFSLTGQRNVEKIYETLKTCSEDCAISCMFFNLLNDGPVSASRMIVWPFHDKLLRSKRGTAFLNDDTNKIEKRDIYPPLSKFEIGYMDLKKTDVYLPWISGYQYWEINKEHYYTKLMIDNNQLFIAGPSGNTDLQFSILKIFKDYDFNLSLLSCIAWMCNTPDHSPCEILLATIPFGLNDWDITIDSFGYIEGLLSKT